METAMNRAFSGSLIGFISVLVIVLFYTGYSRSETNKVSRFGEYSGYSKEIYDGYERSSDYLKLSDGTKLAYDLLLPTKGGLAAREALPVLFCFTTYLRAYDMVNSSSSVTYIFLFNIATKRLGP